MSAQGVSRDLLMPRDPGGSRRGIALSVLVHIGLVVAIAFGLNWRSHEPEAQQAELWAAVPQAAAPREVEPIVQPPPPAPPTPAPVVQPEAKVVEPPKPEPLPDAQIAIEQARKEAERKALEEKERKEKQAAERDAQKKKLALEKAEKAERAEKAAKAERERVEKQDAEKKKLQQALEAQQAKQREAARADQLKRIQGLAGASGDAGATGSALRSAGPSAGYAGRIRALVKGNLHFPDQIAGNPTAEVEVRTVPDGTIIGRRLVKSSGIPSYDEAVLRAIDKTAVLPRDTAGDGRVPASLLLVFQPNE